MLTNKIISTIDVRQLMILISICCILLVFSMMKDDRSDDDLKWSDADGLTGIEVNRGDSSTYIISVSAERGEERVEKDVTLVLSDPEDDKETKEQEASENATLESQVQEVIDKVRSTEGKKVVLPLRLEDGTVLRWEDASSDKNIIIILMIPVLYIVFSYLQFRQKEKDTIRERRESILISLPSFNNQLLILSGCGMVFSDAYRMIAGSYQSDDHGSYFRKMIVEVRDKADYDKVSLTKALTERAEREGVRELSRIVNLINENQYIGMDLSEKLMAESSILWDRRKRVARERGKKAETSMTMPLAMLLMALILVTAAPAMLEVKGG